MQRASICIIHSKSLERWKGWMGGQVEVNKEMVGMEGEEMRVVLCEDDLESSRGGRGRSGEKRAQRWRGESQVPRDRVKWREENLAGRETGVINRNVVQRKTESGSRHGWGKRLECS